MSKINIDPAVARLEDAALIAHYRNRNLLLAQMCSEQEVTISALNQAISTLTERLNGLEAQIEEAKPPGDSDVVIDATAEG